MTIAFTDLHPCNPIRLGANLNLAVFFKEIMSETAKGILLLQSALQTAVDKMDDEGADQYTDTKALMDIMAINLAQWRRSLVDEPEEVVEDERQNLLLIQEQELAEQREIAKEPEFEVDAM